MLLVMAKTVECDFCLFHFYILCNLLGKLSEEGSVCRLSHHSCQRAKERQREGQMLENLFPFKSGRFGDEVRGSRLVSESSPIVLRTLIGVILIFLQNQLPGPTQMYRGGIEMLFL